MRTYVRTYGRTDGRGRPPNFLGLMDFPFSMGMELRPRAPSAPAGAPLLENNRNFIQNQAGMLTKGMCGSRKWRGLEIPDGGVGVK